LGVVIGGRHAVSIRQQESPEGAGP
jgi:hypothetical protein